MVTGKPVSEIVDFLDNERETTLKEMFLCLEHFGFYVDRQRHQVEDKKDLPNFCFLSLETPKCWHWSLYADGVFYDPEHGVLDDFPASRRRYFWAIKKPD